MHIPDGFLTPPVWASLAAVSAPAIGIAARRAQRTLDESRVPLMGVIGAFVFAAQMINFPVAAGASGHLVGGALLAIVLGLAPAMIVMTAILVLQALIFQDGGLLALGANVFNMAVAGVFAAWLPWRWLSSSRARTAGIFLAGFLSVFVSASLCLGELALAGVRLPSPVLSLAFFVFCLTGVLEGAITAAVARSLERINPHWLTVPTAGRSVLAALAVAAVILAAAGFLVASSLPDGLERVAGLVGIEGKEVQLFATPLADYELAAANQPWLRKAAAGLFGLALAYLLTLGAGRLIARRRGA